jgi:hypothetical protein
VRRTVARIAMARASIAAVRLLVGKKPSNSCIEAQTGSEASC